MVLQWTIGLLDRPSNVGFNGKAQLVGALVLFRARSLEVTGVQPQNKAEKATEQCLWQITNYNCDRSKIHRLHNEDGWMMKHATCPSLQHCEDNTTKTLPKRERKAKKSEQQVVFAWQLLQWNGTKLDMCNLLSTFGPRGYLVQEKHVVINL